MMRGKVKQTIALLLPITERLQKKKVKSDGMLYKYVEEGGKIFL